MSALRTYHDQDKCLLQELEGFIECNVCYSVPDDPPIYQCANGHLFCIGCYEKLTNCPCCREPLFNVRSRLAEKILEKIATCCEFEQYGCDVMMAREDLPAHTKLCRYREVDCPSPSCGDTVSLSCLAKHFLTSHRDHIPSSQKSLRVKCTFTARFQVKPVPPLNNVFWDSIPHCFNKVFFFLQFGRIADSSKGSANWYIWIYAGLTSNQCEKFVCTLKISNQGSKEALSLTCPVVSLDVYRQQVPIFASI